MIGHTARPARTGVPSESAWVGVGGGTVVTPPVTHWLSLPISTKNNGTKKIARNVAASMPPSTPVPIDRRLAAPAPVAITSGSTPRMKAIEVIMMGRKRSLAASIADSTSERPSWCCWLANSTMRMAFFADSQISVTNPIWK